MNDASRNAWNHWRMDGAAVAVVLGLTAIAYFGQVAPTIQGNELAKAQAVELVTQQTKSRDLERTIRSTSDHLEATRQAIAKNALQLEPATELNKRLARLSDLASANHLQVDAIESGETRDYDRYSTVSIRLAGHGTYPNCQAALGNLRSAMPDIGVTSMQVNSGGVTNDTAATFAFDLLWYTQAQPKTSKK
jgi:Tfp pilus assembly protein PilO